VRALRAGSLRERTYLRERLRERVKESFWIVPAPLTAACILLAFLMRQLDGWLLATHHDPGSWLTGTASGAAGFVGTISTSMLTFLAVVFSITLVAVQMASQQFSPRVVRTFSRSNITKVALGTFMGTFAYALMVQNFLLRSPRQGSAIIPIVSVTVAVLLVLVSLAVFLAFVSALLRLVRLPFMLSAIANETRAAIEENCPTTNAYVLVPPPHFDAADHVLGFSKPPGWALLAPHPEHGVLQSVDVPGLVRVARSHECVMRLLPRLGQYLFPGDPILAVYGGQCPPHGRTLRNFDVGRERTVFQDPSYGFRQLVDVAAQALSPAINAPTTAVQVIGRLEGLLLALARRPWPTGIYVDEEDQVRLVVPVPSWEELVDLAFTEIRHYGVRAPQVTRRSMLLWIPFGIRFRMTNSSRFSDKLSCSAQRSRRRRP
jgi:uncharacterized membrane protein